MNKFYYCFSFIPPSLAAINKRMTAKGFESDCEDSRSFWIEAESKEKAHEWGEKLAVEYVGTLYVNPEVSLREYGLSAWHEGWIDERGPMASWLENDIEKHTKEYRVAKYGEVLQTIPVIKYGEYPDIKKLVEEQYGPGPY